jgi:phenylalanyl-tRNA synthetase alpha chain
MGFLVKEASMIDSLEKIKGEALSALTQVNDEDALQQWKVAYLGRSSALMGTFDKLGQAPKEERPLIGRKANEVKQALEAAFTEKAEQLKKEAVQRALQSERLDVTLPGRPQIRGRLHPQTQTLRRIYEIYGEMGFQVYRTREVETDEYNFQLLNFPPDHPAREMQDSFFVTTGREREDNPLVMRTHTSPGQIHAMREYSARNPENPPPVRVILPGMCFRYEQVSTRYEKQFYQVEGLAVGHHITFGDLKGTLADFARRMYGQDVHVRFRASYFPFTEPSAELDVECFLCGGKGCQVCKQTGWLEILGCGMVHPVVLANGGYDPQRYSGFAFGMGVERITMLLHAVQDIRYFWANDMRFLEQF